MQMKKEVSVTLDRDKKKSASDESGRNRVRLLSMLFLTFSYFLVEIIVGYMTDSVALVADSFHMLSDVISLVIAYIAVGMSAKRKKSKKNSFGWARAEVLGALVNAVFLVALCFSIIVESIERFFEIKEIKNPKLILIVGGVGLVINLIGLVLFHGHGHSHGGSGHNHGSGHGHSHSNYQQHAKENNQHKIHFSDNSSGHKIDLVSWGVIGSSDMNKTSQNSIEDFRPEIVNNNSTNEETPVAISTSSATQMNMHGVFLHVLADALGSVIVVISALIIWLTNWEYRMYVDPVLSLVMVILIICSVWPLFMESAMVLLQTIPTHIQIDELKNKLLVKVQGALEVHEFHIWQLAGNRIIASAHILCKNPEDYMRLGEEIKEFFHNEGIHSTTIQLEFAQSSDNLENDGGDTISDTRSDCFLTCPFDDENTDCVSNTCCGIQKKKTTSSTAITNANANTNSNLAFVSEPDDNIDSTIPVITTHGS